MGQLSSPGQSRLTGVLSGLRAPLRHRWAPVLLVLFIPWLLGWSWKDASGDTINPNFVQRIQDGKTTKQEVLLYFGDPKESQGSPSEGVVYKYFSYKDAEAMPYQPSQRVPEEQSTSEYLLQDKQVKKKPPPKTGGKILRSTLEIRFKPGSDTVMSHEYKEF